MATTETPAAQDDTLDWDAAISAVIALARAETPKHVSYHIERHIANIRDDARSLIHSIMQLSYHYPDELGDVLATCEAFYSELRI